MFQLNNFYDNQNMICIAQFGQYKIFEHQKDLSVSPQMAETAYFASEMNVKKRQVLVELNNTGCTVQAGEMQWMLGNVQMSSGVKGVGNFLGKMVGGAVTGESGVKPEYSGQGLLMLEPTYKHLISVDVGQWGGSIVLDDGLFLVSDSSLQHKIVARSNISSAVFGREGLFNLSLNGQGLAILESPVPQAELIQFNLQDDVVKIDGNMAIAWSGSLEFTVEKSGKSLLGSAVSGEGLVNVYRGTGKIWMAPVTTMIAGAGRSDLSENASTGRTGSASANAGMKAMDKADKISSFLDRFS